MPGNILSSPAFEKAVAAGVAKELAATPDHRLKRRGTNSLAKPPRSVKKPRVASGTPAMSARQKASILNHQQNNSEQRLKRAEAKRNKASYIGRGGAK